MSMINARELRKMYVGLGPRKCMRHLRESMEAGDLKPRDFSIQELAEGLMSDRRGNPMGSEYIRSLHPRRQGSHETFEIQEAVDSAAFANITGQMAYTTFLQAYENTAFIGDQFVTTVPTLLNGEKIPGVTGLGDDSQTVEEGKPYPRAGVSEDWIITPETIKRGIIVEVTKESIFFDTTGQFLSQCTKVGEAIGLSKEKRILDMVIGVTNNYNWKGTAYDTYVATPWDNITATNAIADYTDIDAMLATFAALVDPATEEPILMVPDTIWLKTSLRATMNYVLNSTHVQLDPNASAATANIHQFVPNNVLIPGNYNVISSPLMDARFVAGSVTATDWFMGSPKQAFAYMENWPITTTPMGPNSYAEWNNDVVAGFKASERGTVAVLEPRKVGKSTAA